MRIGRSVALVAAACALAGCAHGVAPAPAEDSGPIAEMRYVRIGGIDQWITIRGKHRNNPVVLVLHGGPGMAWSGFADQVFADDWRERFTIVQWDQRGAGRTYTATGPSVASTMTMDRMVQDGVELTQFLERELRQNKIILTGASWGSLLGVYMVKARPELYCAYVGVAQVVSMNATLAASYPRVLAAARAQGNAQAIEELTAIGPPPWTEVKSIGTNMRWANQLEPHPPQAFDVEVSPEYATAKDFADHKAAGDMSIAQLLGPDGKGPLMQIDLPTLGMKFDVPVVVVQGAHDMKAVPDVTQAYFDRIEAPFKKLVVDPDSGHEPSKTLVKLWLKVLDNDVRPRCAR